MRKHPSVSFFNPWFWAAITFLAFGLGLVCFGQEVAVPVIPAEVNTGLSDWIIEMAEKYPWIVGVLGVIGSLRVVIKPLLAFARLMTSQTATTKDEEFLDKVERSWLFTAFLFALDWLTSIKVNPATTTKSSKAMDVGCWMLVVGCLALSTACVPLAPGGVYNGDQVLQKSELTITTSYEVIHTYVTWEKANRDALASVPEIKASADAMRAGAKQWFATANALRDAYAAVPSDANKAALTQGLAVLQTAMNEAVKYMSQAAATK